MADSLSQRYTGLFRDRSTVLHRLDPRVKILLFVAALATLQCFNRVAFVATLFAVLVLTTVAVGAGLVLLRAGPVITIAMLISATTWAVHLAGPTVLWSLGPIVVSAESLSFGAALGLRLGAMFAVGLVFLTVTRLDDIHAGLVLLRVPRRLAFIFSLSLAFLPMYVAVALSILEAQTVRGLDLRSGSLYRRVQKGVGIAVPLFLHVARQTHLRAIALESRGFAVDQPRSTYREYRMTAQDGIALLGAALLLIMCIALRVAGVGYAPVN